MGGYNARLPTREPNKNNEGHASAMLVDQRGHEGPHPTVATRREERMIFKRYTSEVLC